MAFVWEIETRRIREVLLDDMSFGGRTPSPRTVALHLRDASLSSNTEWYDVCAETITEWRGDRSKLLPHKAEADVHARVEKGGHVDIKRGKGDKASLMLRVKGAGSGSYRLDTAGDLVPCAATDERVVTDADAEVKASVQFGSTTHMAALYVLVGCCHWWYLAQGGDESVNERHAWSNAVV
jgi:hypothetical protein